MAIIPRDYVERLYAGWLGKLIGIRYGAPIEGWTYDKIWAVYGELDGYLVDYREFAADDDSNGPMIFIRALNDYTHTRDITAEQIGLTWLNYAPYEHGFYWWGGFGNSTEHTAYLNLRAGIPAPRSGSVEQNGAAIAEQIGGQIFIDSWGLVLPGRPELAAEYAAKAASVSHGGNGIYGGQYVAAAIALAFTAKDIRAVLDGALTVIPGDCEYARAVRDVMAFYDNHTCEDWRAAFEYVRERWGYHRYPGNCHIIPNSAVMVLSMLYGGGDFDRTLNICNMCGWDTDCNAGNVGAIMGVLCGLEAIDYKKWREPINDFFAVSSVLGCLNGMDAPWCVGYLADLAYRMADEDMPADWRPYLTPGRRYDHFKLPGSTHGFRVAVEKQKQVETSLANSGEGGLKVSVLNLLPTEAFRIFKRTYYGARDFHDNRYDPAFSPILYPGQTVRLRIKQADFCDQELYAAIYVRDAHDGRLIEGERVRLTPGEWRPLALEIPALRGALLDEAGVRVVAGGDCGYGKRNAVVVFVDEVRFEGRPNYGIDFAREYMEMYTPLHREVSQFTYLKGAWSLESGRLMGLTPDYGEAYTGDIAWDDYRLTGSVSRACGDRAALLVRVQGAIRSYAVMVRADRLSIEKNANGYAELASCPFDAPVGAIRRLTVEVRGNQIRVLEGESQLLCATDDDPYRTGCVGCGVYDGTRAYFDDLVIEPLN